MAVVLLSTVAVVVVVVVAVDQGVDGGAIVHLTVVVAAFVVVEARMVERELVELVIAVAAVGFAR